MCAFERQEDYSPTIFDFLGEQEPSDWNIVPDDDTLDVPFQPSSDDDYHWPLDEPISDFFDTQITYSRRSSEPTDISEIVEVVEVAQVQDFAEVEEPIPSSDQEQSRKSKRRRSDSSIAPRKRRANGTKFYHGQDSLARVQKVRVFRRTHGTLEYTWDRRRKTWFTVSGVEACSEDLMKEHIPSLIIQADGMGIFLELCWDRKSEEGFLFTVTDPITEEVAYVSTDNVALLIEDPDHAIAIDWERMDS